MIKKTQQINTEGTCLKTNKGYIWKIQAFPGGGAVKNPPANAGGHERQIPGPGRSPGEGNGNPLQYYFPGNPMDRGAWRASP